MSSFATPRSRRTVKMASWLKFGGDRYASPIRGRIPFCYGVVLGSPRTAKAMKSHER